MSDEENSNSRINSELDRVLKELLKEVTKKYPADYDQSKIPSLTDKMKVIDRVLKWEMIKGKLNDGAWGSGFNDE